MSGSIRAGLMHMGRRVKVPVPPCINDPVSGYLYSFEDDFEGFTVNYVTRSNAQAYAGDWSLEVAYTIGVMSELRKVSNWCPGISKVEVEFYFANFQYRLNDFGFWFYDGEDWQLLEGIENQPYGVWRKMGPYDVTSYMNAHYGIGAKRTGGVATGAAYLDALLFTIT